MARCFSHLVVRCYTAYSEAAKGYAKCLHLTALSTRSLEGEREGGRKERNYSASLYIYRYIFLCTLHQEKKPSLFLCAAASLLTFCSQGSEQLKKLRRGGDKVLLFQISKGVPHNTESISVFGRYI